MTKKELGPVKWAGFCFRVFSKEWGIELPIWLEYLRLKIATNLASFYHLGFLYSEVLETSVMRLAKRIEKRIGNHLRNQSLSKETLHVLSRAYASGGHTRVIERWIESSDQKSSAHSVLLTRRQNIPETLRNAKNLVSLIPLPGKGIAHVLKLANVMSSYGQLVSHAHPNDIDVVLALHVVKDFKTGSRVAIFNHSDHRFWLGSKAADLILEFRSFGQYLTEHYRSSIKSYVLGLPLPSASSLRSGATRRDSAESVNLIAVGRGHKFSPVPGEPVFAEFADKFLGRNPRFKLTIVGPSKFSAIKRFRFVNRDRVQFLDLQNIHSLFDIYSQSHVGVDSFPMTGGTVTTEMSLSNLPVVSMRGAVGLVDSLPGDNWYVADNYEEWEDSILRAAEIKLAVGTSLHHKTEIMGWGASVDYLLKHDISNSSSKEEISIARLQRFLWATEPRIRNIFSGRAL